MTKLAFTPGPWIWNDQNRALYGNGFPKDADPYDWRDEPPVRIIETDSGVYPPEAADAALIAAAPELYEALIEARNLLQQPVEGLPLMFENWWNIFGRAALAKAEGRT